MKAYVVELEAVVPSLATVPVEEQERRTDALLDSLEDMAREGAYGIEVPAAFGGIGGKLGGRFYVQATEADAALDLGMSALREALSRIGCPEGLSGCGCWRSPSGRKKMKAMSERTVPGKASKPDQATRSPSPDRADGPGPLDDLVTGAEIGRRLGVTRERVRQWASDPRYQFPAFPRPSAASAERWSGAGAMWQNGPRSGRRRLPKSLVVRSTSSFHGHDDSLTT